MTDPVGLSDDGYAGGCLRVSSDCSLRELRLKQNARKGRLTTAINQMNSNEEWLPTPLAIRALGYSARTLKRYRDRNGGFLIAGQDWCFGPTGASSISWNITTCRQKFHERGKLMIGIDSVRKELAEVG